MCNGRLASEGRVSLVIQSCHVQETASQENARQSISCSAVAGGCCSWEVGVDVVQKAVTASVSGMGTANIIGQCSLRRDPRPPGSTEETTEAHFEEQSSYPCAQDAQPCSRQAMPASSRMLTSRHHVSCTSRVSLWSRMLHKAMQW